MALASSGWGALAAAAAALAALGAAASALVGDLIGDVSAAVTAVTLAVAPSTVMFARMLPPATVSPSPSSAGMTGDGGRAPSSETAPPRSSKRPPKPSSIVWALDRLSSPASLLFSGLLFTLEGSLRGEAVLAAPIVARARATAAAFFLGMRSFSMSAC